MRREIQFRIIGFFFSFPHSNLCGRQQNPATPETRPCVSTSRHYLFFLGGFSHEQGCARCRTVRGLSHEIDYRALQSENDLPGILCFLSLSWVAETEKRTRFILKPFEADRAIYNRWDADLLLQKKYIYNSLLAFKKWLHGFTV